MTIDGGERGPADIIVVESAFEQAAEKFRSEILRHAAQGAGTT
jgi:hypothetical protein